MRRPARRLPKRMGGATRVRRVIGEVLSVTSRRRNVMSAAATPAAAIVPR